MRRNGNSGCNYNSRNTAVDENFNSPYHHDLREQPYPDTNDYLIMGIFLVLFDCILLFWIFTMRCGCKDAGNQLFCKLFCCNYWCDLDVNPIQESNQKHRSETSELISNDVSGDHRCTMSYTHLDTKITEYTM